MVILFTTVKRNFEGGGIIKCPPGLVNLRHICGEPLVLLIATYRSQYSFDENYKLQTPSELLNLDAQFRK